MHTPTYRRTNTQVAFVYFRGIYLYPLTTVGGDRERLVCPRRGRGRDCAPAALDRALLGGPSTSPLERTGFALGEHSCPTSTRFSPAQFRGYTRLISYR